MSAPLPPAFSYGPLTLTDLVRYAGASGDFNRLHHDEAYAKAAGLPGVMAHGMLSAGLLGSFVTRWFGPGSVRRFKVRFREKVFVGDRLSAEGRVVGEVEGGYALELALKRDDGVVVVSGSAEVAAP
jgi:acyl dehydratase